MAATATHAFVGEIWLSSWTPCGRGCCRPAGIIAASLSVLPLRTTAAAAATAGADRDSFRKSPIAKSGGHGFSE